MISRRRVLLTCLAIIGLATCAIHFKAAGPHFQQYWLYGTFMVAIAWLQLLWSLVALASPSRPLLWSGVLLNAGIVAVYLVTRTVGDVIGPGRNAAEPVGFGDALCTVLEVVVVAGCAWLLATSADRRVHRAHLVTAAAATGSATAVLLSVALVAGGPEMVMSASASSPSHGHRMRTSGHMTMRMPKSAIRLANASPAGDITMPAPNMQMPHGMRMASSAACDARPSAAQQKAAVRLVNASWKGAARFRSLAAAKAAGYRPITPVGLPVVHYLNVGYYIHDALHQKILSTRRPQSLVYANTPHGAVLVAAMYITTPGGPTPQPGGCLTQWHIHTNLCLVDGVVVVAVINAAHPTCPQGSRNRITPPMMHVWFVPIPGGPTAIDAPDRAIVRAAKQVRAPHNGPA
jgi:hypothetical protein